MVVFVVGPPGVGKTTLVKELLGGFTHLVPKPKWTVAERLVAAGHYGNGTFDGADTVPYNGVKDALAYWKENFRERLTVFDGDRFSYGGVLDFFEQERIPFAAAVLSATDATLTARREERGSKQNPTWMRGRATKAQNFVAQLQERQGATVIPFDAHESTKALAKKFWRSFR